MLDALADGGVYAGVPKDLALKLTAHTMIVSCCHCVHIHTHTCTHAHNTHITTTTAMHAHTIHNRVQHGWFWKMVYIRRRYVIALSAYTLNSTEKKRVTVSKHRL